MVMIAQTILDALVNVPDFIIWYSLMKSTAENERK